MEKGAFQADQGILAFEHTSEVIQAERLLKNSGWDIRVMGQPPEIQTGCDLVIVFPLIEQLEIVRLLTARNNIPLRGVSMRDPLLEPVRLPPPPPAPGIDEITCHIPRARETVLKGIKTLVWKIQNHGIVLSPRFMIPLRVTDL